MMSLSLENRNLLGIFSLTNLYFQNALIISFIKFIILHLSSIIVGSRKNFTQ